MAISNAQTYAAKAFSGMGANKEFIMNGSKSNSLLAKADGLALDALAPAAGSEPYCAASLSGLRANPQHLLKSSLTIAQLANDVGEAVFALGLADDAEYIADATASVCASSVSDSKNVAAIAAQIAIEAALLTANL